MELSTKVAILDFEDKPYEITMFQLLQWKHSISLEMQGMKHSRGSVTAHVRGLLRAPADFPRESLFEHLSVSIRDIMDQLRTGIRPAGLLTRAQRVAVKRVWDRVGPPEQIPYRDFRKGVMPSLGGVVMVEWCGMWLGIELDGYTHS